jgi:DNA-binding Lrp family transcriptional regulator
VDAFVYLRIRPGKVEDVLMQLEAARGVHHSTLVVGDWDVLAAVHGPDLTSIAADVLRSLHRIDGIERSLTTPVVPGHVVGLAGGGLGSTMPMQRTGPACFVRIQTTPETTTQIFESLTEIDEVAGVALVAGDDDILAEIPFEWEEAARVVLERIQGLPGVRSTNTLVAVEQLPAEDEDRDQFSAWS